MAFLAFEVVAVAGTTLLFLACRGPGHALVTRLGARVGLTAQRMNRAAALVERRGSPALAVGRATPGLRTITVLAAGGSGISLRRALPALALGSSVFLQLHLFLGYFLGSTARHVLNEARGPAIAVLAILAVGAIGFWFVRGGRRSGSQAFTEGFCPACLALAALSEHEPLVEGLA